MTEGDTSVDVETTAVSDATMVVEVVGNIPEVTDVDLETIPTDDTAVVVEVVGSI